MSWLGEQRGSRESTQPCHDLDLSRLQTVFQLRGRSRVPIAEHQSKVSMGSSNCNSLDVSTQSVSDFLINFRRHRATLLFPSARPVRPKRKNFHAMLSALNKR